MLASITLALAVAALPADLLLGLDVGAELATATTALARSDLVSWEASAPQALRRGLVDTSLLEAVNRAGAGRQDRDGALEAKDFARFVALREGGADYVLAFDASSRLSFLFAKLPTPLADADPFAKARLRPLVDVLRSLRRAGLGAPEVDAYGNPRQWRGRSRRGRLWARYVPDKEQVWLLLSPQRSR